MFIKVLDTQTANKLNNAMTSGNCIVLYHMQGCPYCVQMMPDWTNFIQIATKQHPNLTIGEVERTHLAKLGSNTSGVNSFPTIKFYKSGANNIVRTAPTLNTPIKHKNFNDLLKGIISMNNAPPSSGHSLASDNSVMFEDARTTDKLIKFVKNNLVNKSKKALGSSKLRSISHGNKKKQVATKKTKKGSPKPSQNPNITSNADYKRAKNTDSQTALNIKNEILNQN